MKFFRTYRLACTIVVGAARRVPFEHHLLAVPFALPAEQGPHHMAAARPAANMSANARRRGHQQAGRIRHVLLVLLLDLNLGNGPVDVRSQRLGLDHDLSSSWEFHWHPLWQSRCRQDFFAKNIQSN